MPVRDNDGLVLLTSTNKIVRISVDEVRTKGRATMGVMLVRLDEGARVVGFDRVDEGGQTGRSLELEAEDALGESDAASPADALPESNKMNPAADLDEGRNQDDDV